MEIKSRAPASISFVLLLIFGARAEERMYVEALNVIIRMYFLMLTYSSKLGAEYHGHGGRYTI